MDGSIEELIARVVREEIRALSVRNKKLLEMSEAAEYLGVSEAGLDNLVSDKRLIPVRFDRRKRFDIVDLDKLIEESKRV